MHVCTQNHGKLPPLGPTLCTDLTIYTLSGRLLYRCLFYICACSFFCLSIISLLIFCLFFLRLWWPLLCNGKNQRFNCKNAIEDKTLSINHLMVTRPVVRGLSYIFAKFYPSENNDLQIPPQQQLLHHEWQFVKCHQNPNSSYLWKVIAWANHTPLCQGQQLHEVSSPSLSHQLKYMAQKIFVCVRTVTLTLEIWTWVKVMIYPLVMDNICVNYSCL